MSVAFAGGEKKEHLIKLDQKWGAAGTAGDTDTVGKLLAKGLVAVDGTGVHGKAEQLENNEPAPEGTTYEPSDYQVTFLTDHIAVMTHAVSGDEGAAYSMHVWSNKSGNWQVVATSSTPADSK